MRSWGRLLPIVVVVGLGVAGCTEAPPPPAAPSHPSEFAQGIDLARDARDYSQELKGSRLDFVARYYRDPTSRWPTLSAAEAKAISATGMRLVTVWEWHSHRPDYFSYASGYADGMASYRQAKGVGQPPGSAIYFAVDFNAFDPDIRGRIDPYFR
ncbi:MAG: glycoside hydrolase domain-containing protein, partial [Stellaceae bacterium]